MRFDDEDYKDVLRESAASDSYKNSPIMSEKAEYSYDQIVDEPAVEAAPVESGDAALSREEEKARRAKKEADDAKKEFWGFLGYCVFLFIVGLLVLKFVGQRTVVDGESMMDTLYNHDNLIMDKISYSFSDPKRFDVICFPPAFDKTETYIKRIIGMPGEMIYIDGDGTIYINGHKLEENYGLEAMEYAGRAEETLILGEDEYFVLGDNRNNSTDSRFMLVGNVKREDIIGKAWVRIWPLNRIGFVDDLKKLPEE